MSWWELASTHGAVATAVRARLLRIRERLGSKAIRPWAFATVYGGIAALFAWLDGWSPWWGLAVAAVVLLVERRRAREGLPSISEDVRVRRLMSIWNWVTLVLFILIVAWLLIWIPGRMW